MDKQWEDATGLVGLVVWRLDVRFYFVVLFISGVLKQTVVYCTV